MKNFCFKQLIHDFCGTNVDNNEDIEKDLSYTQAVKLANANIAVLEKNFIYDKKEKKVNKGKINKLKQNTTNNCINKQSVKQNDDKNTREI